jgi:hypothetical protein
VLLKVVDQNGAVKRTVTGAYMDKGLHAEPDALGKLNLSEISETDTTLLMVDQLPCEDKCTPKINEIKNKIQGEFRAFTKVKVNPETRKGGSPKTAALTQSKTSQELMELTEFQKLRTPSGPAPGAAQVPQAPPKAPVALPTTSQPARGVPYGEPSTILGPTGQPVRGVLPVEGVEVPPSVKGPSSFAAGLVVFQLGLGVLAAVLPDPLEQIAIKAGLDQRLKETKWQGRLTELEPLVQQATQAIYYNIEFKVVYSATKLWHWRASEQYQVKDVEILDIRTSGDQIEKVGKRNPPNRPPDLQMKNMIYSWEAQQTCIVSVLGNKTPTSELTSDTDIRDWMAKANSAVINDLPQWEKIRLINRLLDGWVSDDDIKAIGKIYRNTPSSQLPAVKQAIEKRILDLMSISQRTQLRVILAGG